MLWSREMQSLDEGSATASSSDGGEGQQTTGSPHTTQAMSSSPNGASDHSSYNGVQGKDSRSRSGSTSGSDATFDAQASTGRSEDDASHASDKSNENRTHSTQSTLASHDNEFDHELTLHAAPRQLGRRAQHYDVEEIGTNSEEEDGYDYEDGYHRGGYGDERFEDSQHDYDGNYRGNYDDFEDGDASYSDEDNRRYPYDKEEDDEETHDMHEFDVDGTQELPDDMQGFDLEWAPEAGADGADVTDIQEECEESEEALALTQLLDALQVHARIRVLPST